MLLEFKEGMFMLLVFWRTFPPTCVWTPLVSHTFSGLCENLFLFCTINKFLRKIYAWNSLHSLFSCIPKASEKVIHRLRPFLILYQLVNEQCRTCKVTSASLMSPYSELYPLSRSEPQVLRYLLCLCTQVGQSLSNLHLRLSHNREKHNKWASVYCQEPQSQGECLGPSSRTSSTAPIYVTLEI